MQFGNCQENFLQLIVNWGCLSANGTRAFRIFGLISCPTTYTFAPAIPFITFEMKRLFFPFLFVFPAFNLPAQAITEDPAISRMMENFVEYNRANSKVRGWRIQILSTTDRRVMEETQSKFKWRYPEYELLFVHQDPYYHLRTGAFMSQLDARALLKKLQKDFPAAFIVTDEFEIAEVLEYLE